MLKVFLFLGAAACVMAASIPVRILHSDGFKQFRPPTVGGPSDNLWTVTTEDHAKIVMICVLKDDCRKVSIDIWDGVNHWDGCEPIRRQASNTSINSQMSVRIRTTGSELPALCQVTATKPYIGLPEKEIDSSEHGIEIQKNSDCRCGWANKDGSRIVGGKETKVNEYPFAALIVKTNGGPSFSPFCTGSIITKRHVLTAAHCFGDKVASTLQVWLGEHNMIQSSDSKHTVKIPVERIINHEDYDTMRHHNDIALLVLKQDITFNDHVGPVCMPTAVKNLVSEHVKVMGWGLTTHKGEGSDVLRKVNLKVIDPDVCKVIYGTDPSDETQFCTFANNKDSCQGDSGGPLVWLNQKNTFTQYGVVSYGRACASTDPGVNTNVPKYLDWIKQKIAATYPQRLCN